MSQVCFKTTSVSQENLIWILNRPEAQEQEDILGQTS